jgi:hypothetical protein
LHLNVVQKNGYWYCSGIILRRSYGFKKYVFYVSSAVDKLDVNMVGGLFTHFTDDEEIDIEFSKWSDPDNINNAQFAIQPSFKPGNKERFNLDLSNNNASTHFFDWKPDSISFGSFIGHKSIPDSTDKVNTWVYKGDDIPPAGNERLKINLWLFRGAPPSNGIGGELIIDKVEIY